MTFLALVFWAWVLGPLGALLTIPMTLLVKAMLLDIDPATRWVNVLIGEKAEDVAVPPDPDIPSPAKEVDDPSPEPESVVPAT